MSPAKRWALLHDEDRDMLCPEDRVAEARSMLAKFGEFWGDDDREDDGTVGPPMPDFLIAVEGELLTFESPSLNGVPVQPGLLRVVKQVLDLVEAKAHDTDEPFETVWSGEFDNLMSLLAEAFEQAGGVR